MKVKYRKYKCDKCGAIHIVQTNHMGKIYMQKCKNWGCTSGCYDFTSMSFYNGKTVIKTTNFYTPPDYSNKTKLEFAI